MINSHAVMMSCVIKFGGTASLLTEPLEFLRESTSCRFFRVLRVASSVP